MAMRWIKLAMGLLSIALAVACLHWISPKLPGTAGQTFRQNRDQDIDATALIYTEAGDVKEFLTKDGRYGIQLAPIEPF